MQVTNAEREPKSSWPNARTTKAMCFAATTQPWHVLLHCWRWGEGWRPTNVLLICAASTSESMLSTRYSAQMVMAIVTIMRTPAVARSLICSSSDSLPASVTWSRHWRGWHACEAGIPDTAHGVLGRLWQCHKRGLGHFLRTRLEILREQRRARGEVRLAQRLKEPERDLQ